MLKKLLLFHIALTLAIWVVPMAGKADPVVFNSNRMGGSISSPKSTAAKVDSTRATKLALSTVASVSSKKPGSTDSLQSPHSLHSNKSQASKNTFKNGMPISIARRFHQTGNRALTAPVYQKQMP